MQKKRKKKKTVAHSYVQHTHKKKKTAKPENCVDAQRETKYVRQFRCIERNRCVVCEDERAEWRGGLRDVSSTVMSPGEAGGYKNSETCDVSPQNCASVGG